MNTLTKGRQKKISATLNFLFLVFFLTQCNITEDTECKKQKEGASQCINSFILFCSSNKARTECNGSLEFTLFIGTLCNYDAPCKSTTDDVVKDQNISADSK